MKTAHKWTVRYKLEDGMFTFITVSCGDEPLTAEEIEEYARGYLHRNRARLKGATLHSFEPTECEEQRGRI